MQLVVTAASKGPAAKMASNLATPPWRWVQEEIVPEDKSR